MAATDAYTAQIIDRLKTATEANWATAGRSGSVVTLTEELASEVMVTGDLHGHRTNFNKLRKAADLANHPRRHLILQEVVHGGPLYENSGCMSHSLVEDVAKLKVDFPDRVHYLLSNHELSESTGYVIQKRGSILNLTFRMGVEHMYSFASDRVIAGYNAFIRSCPLAVRWGQTFSCHSIPEGVKHNLFDPGVFSRPWTQADIDPHGSVFELVWGRDYSIENVRAFAQLVNASLFLCGHEPTATGFSTPNDIQVVFDCCHDKACYAILPTTAALDQRKVVDRIQMR